MSDSMTFGNGSEGMGYSLGGSHRAACRLHLQHFLWRESLGYDLHPAVKLPDSPAIADVACGTALWLADVARDMPDATLHGLDVDLAQTPDKHWLPANTRFSKWDIFQDPPEELHHSFDLVHMRLVVVFVKPSAVPKLIKRLRKLLKRGGWIQWDELDASRISVKKVDESQAAPAADEMGRASRSGGQYDWTASIGNSLRSEGMDVVAEEVIGDPPHLVRAFHDQHLLTLDEFAVRLLEEGKKDAARYFAGLIERAYQESQNGAALCIPRMVFVAREK